MAVKCGLNFTNLTLIYSLIGIITSTAMQQVNTEHTNIVVVATSVLVCLVLITAIISAAVVMVYKIKASR